MLSDSFFHSALERLLIPLIREETLLTLVTWLIATAVVVPAWETKSDGAMVVVAVVDWRGMYFHPPGLCSCMEHPFCPHVDQKQSPSFFRRAASSRVRNHFPTSVVAVSTSMALGSLAGLGGLGGE